MGKGIRQAKEKYAVFGIKCFELEVCWVGELYLMELVRRAEPDRKRPCLSSAGVGKSMKAIKQRRQMG